jgi:hypothetical protein
MKPVDPDKLARLPKWARDHINQAHRHMAFMENERDLLAGSPDGRIVVVGHPMMGVRPAVPDDLDPVTWQLQPHIDDHVVVSYTPAVRSHDSLPCVTIRTGRSLVMRPHASNVVSLRPETNNERLEQATRYANITQTEKTR